MTREEYFERERVEKRAIMFLLDLGLTPYSNTILTKEAYQVVDDFMKLLLEWGYVEIVDIDCIIEKSVIYHYYQINKSMVISRNALKKRLRQIDWNSRDGRLLSRHAKLLSELGKL